MKRSILTVLSSHLESTKCRPNKAHHADAGCDWELMHDPVFGIPKSASRITLMRMRGNPHLSPLASPFLSPTLSSAYISHIISNTKRVSLIYGHKKRTINDVQS